LLEEIQILWTMKCGKPSVDLEAQVALLQPFFLFCGLDLHQDGPQDDVSSLEEWREGESKLECSDNNSNHPRTICSIKNEAKTAKKWTRQTFW